MTIVTEMAPLAVVDDLADSQEHWNNWPNAKGVSGRYT